MEGAGGMLGDLAQDAFLYGAVFVFSLVFVILVHEYGHYLMARLFGVRIEKFSIGFGKEIWSRDDRYGTRWCVSRIPLGGFVRIFGDSDAKNPVIRDAETGVERPMSAEERRAAFCTKKVWQRMLIVLAGPLMNAVLTVGLLFGLYFFYGQGSRPPVINALGVGTSSYDDGFQLGDEILEIGGRKVRRFNDIYDWTLEEPGKPFTYKVRRGENTLTIVSASRRVEYTDIKGVERSHGRTGMGWFGSVAFEDILSVDGIPIEGDTDKAREILESRLDQAVRVGLEFRKGREDVFILIFPARYNKHLSDPDNKDYGRIYATDPDFTFYLRLGAGEALYRAFESIKKTALRSFKLMAAIVKGKGTTDEPLIGGVAKMSEIAGNSAKNGVHDYIHFLAMISMVVAFINILPIPLLDGGFLMFLFYEAVTGRQVSPRIQNYAFTIGLAFLGGIMIIANLSDLIRLLK